MGYAPSIIKHWRTSQGSLMGYAPSIIKHWRTAIPERSDAGEFEGVRPLNHKALAHVSAP